MANKTQKSETQAKLYWIFTGLMLLTATPIGIIMVIFKLIETKKQGKPQVDYGTPVGAKTTAGAGARARKNAKDALAPLQKKAAHRVRVGGILTVFFAFMLAVSMGDAFALLSHGFLDFLAEVWPMLCCTAVCGAYLATGLNLRKKLRRFRSYLSMIGYRQTVPVQSLATAARIAPATVREDLEEMLDLGLFSEGFLDYNSDRLLLTSEGLSDPPPAREKQEPARQPSAADRENALLAEIKAVNDLVQNEKLSAQIDRIGVITAKILDYQKSHPHKAPQLHSFLSYYLPTTLKILRAYGQLEAQEVSGENISAAMKRIEDMMDKVVEGFEKQLDQLFMDDAMDITTDVEVLERMLAKDGLSGNGITLNL